MKENSKRRDYHKPQWTMGEFFPVLIRCTLVVVFLAFFFYRSALAIIPLSGIGYFYFKMLEKDRIREAKEELNSQFKECILSVSTALKAGYAVENAFVESEKDMELLYGRKSYIYRELEFIRRGMIINITLEEQLEELAARSGSEEIAQFAGVFAVAKHNGGNLSEVIQTSSDLIGQRIEMQQEIQTLLQGRRMEQNIMKVMPFLVLLYVDITIPGYFDVLYHQGNGIAVMTLCLALYLGAYYLGEKMLRNIV